MATSLPPVRIAERPSEGPADLHVIVDLTGGQSSHAPSVTIRPIQPPPALHLVPSNPQPPPPRTPAKKADARRFIRGETIATGFQRMGIGLLDRAIDAITVKGGPGDEEVHTARKAMRRLRGLLRLVRDDLGPVYAAENAVLRDTARLLSDVRSSAVAGTALTELMKHFGPMLADGIYNDLAEQLEQRHRDIAARTLENRLVLAGVTSNLRHARTRLAAFPTSPGTDLGYHGPLLPNDSELLVRGMARTYERGLIAMKEAAANPFPEQLHEWRKRVRYLRYQMESLAPAWPEVMSGLCRSLDDLAESLGHERDLWELSETVRREPDLCDEDAARELLSALTLESRHSMRERSFRAGTRIYVEAPETFARRIQTYWDAWNPPGTGGNG